MKRHDQPRHSTALFAGALLTLALASSGCDGGSEIDDEDATGSPVPECGDDPAPTTEHANGLFDYEHVPSFDIRLPPERWDDLLANAVDEQWEQVDACFEGKRIGTIGLRFKGSHGTLYGCFDESGELTCPRLSMKLKFSQYDEELRFFGLKRLNFHANRHDDSRMRERLVYDLYRAVGVPAPRAGWAVVHVNGESQGLYGMVEELDGRFTEDRWPDHPNGNLYKELWPTDTDPSDIEEALRTNEDKPDVDGFAALSQAVDAAEDDAAVLESLEEFTDLDHWARYMAVDDAVVSYDGVTYFYTEDGTESHNHNCYFYEDSPSHFTLVPWDVESSFWINPDHAAPHWTDVPEDCSLTYPYWGGLASAPGCDPVFGALNTDLDRWRTAARELLDGPFAEASMIDAIDSHANHIRKHASATETPTMYTSFDGAVEELKRTVPKLRFRLEQLIASSESAD